MTPAAIAAFWSKVDRSEGPDACWPWLAGGSDGYGIMRLAVPRRTARAHRLAYELAVGMVPAGLLVRHLCHTKRCCNPRHLAVGTARDNKADDVEVDRVPKGSGNGRSRLSEEQVVDIALALAAGVSQHELAREYAVAVSTVHHIAKGRNWSHVTGIKP